MPTSCRRGGALSFQDGLPAVPRPVVGYITKNRDETWSIRGDRTLRKFPGAVMFFAPDCTEAFGTAAEPQPPPKCARRSNTHDGDRADFRAGNAAKRQRGT